MKKIAVTGANGLLGGWLMDRIHQAGHQPLAVLRQPHPDFPVTTSVISSADPGSVFQCLEQQQPDVVIHAAALSVSSACESDPLAANQSNVTLTGVWSDCCAALGIPFAFLSTDLVYPGHTGMQRETDATRSVHVYGDTKIRAERYLAETNHRSWIFRLSLLIGQSLSGNSGFMDQFLGRVSKGEPFTAFSDEYRNALTTQTAAEILIASVLKPIPYGIYNLGGSEIESRYTVAQKILQAAGYPAHLVTEGSVHDFTGYPPRQPDVTMRTDKLCKALNIDHIPGLASIVQAKPLILS